MPLTDTSLSCKCGGLKMASPVIIASGTWPLKGPLWEPSKLSCTGAVCSKGLTLHPREGNPGTRLWETPSGLLNSIGLENPGIEAFINESLPDMNASGIPILANVAVEKLQDLEKSLELLKSSPVLPNGIELNVSCPNVEGGGMSWGRDGQSVLTALRTARSVWSGPLWVKLTPQMTDLREVLEASESGGADALVVANTWLGMALDIHRQKPVFHRTCAGLSGPAIFPLALRLVWEAAALTNLPIIGCGGISRSEDALAMLLAGASAVEVGTGMFIDLELPKRICNGIREYLEQNHIHSVRNLTNLARRSTLA